MAQDTTVIAGDGDGGITAREVGHGRPLPEGWTIAETRWNGRDIELVVDPSRFDVVRVGSSAAGADATAPLEATGWCHVATDDTGASLWARDARDRPGALDRLSALRSSPGHRHEPPGPSVA